MLRGNCPAKIDEKGRLKVPTAFRAFIEQTYGSQLFVTSVSGDFVLIYPMPVWEDIERKLGELPRTLPAKTRFLERVSYYGQVAELDKQGRVLIHQLLRGSADVHAEVAVLGQMDHLKVWNDERVTAKFKGEPLTDEHLEELAKLGI